MACNNEDVPEWEPTASGDTNGGADGANGADGAPGADETADGSDDGVPVLCWPDHEPTDPTLFQCVGEGAGELRSIQCKQLGGCEPAIAGVCDFDNVEDWMFDAPTLALQFPPDAPQAEPNAQACCESTANAYQTRDGCLSDCARAGCNRALAELQARLADHMANPPFGCGSGDCYDRVVTGLETWIAYLETHYDDCVHKTLRGELFSFPNPDVDAGAGAIACGVLDIDCTLDAETDPYDLEETCSTSENEPQAATGMMLECALDGKIELSGPRGSDFTTFHGTATVRRERSCTTDSCWFGIESLDLDASDLSSHGYIGLDMHASLAYEGFGLFAARTNDGTIAPRMLGLDVTLQGKTPSTSFQSYAFRMGNSDPAIFVTSPGQFQIVDAYFAWQDHELVITSALGDCTCTNCT